MDNQCGVGFAKRIIRGGGFQPDGEYNVLLCIIRLEFGGHILGHSFPIIHHSGTNPGGDHEPGSNERANIFGGPERIRGFNRLPETERNLVLWPDRWWDKSCGLDDQCFIGFTKRIIRGGGFQSDGKHNILLCRFCL